MFKSNAAGPLRKASPVQIEVYKQLGVVALVCAIAFWQLQFVINTANADIYLFCLIVGVGLFGIVNGIVGTYRLGTDYTALEAMKEIHQDLRRKTTAPEDHARVVEQRLGSSLIVHNPPSALANAYNLIVEEVQRSGSLRIPIGTMQILVSDFESKLEHRQSMLHYLGGLMVLLGLLGTFIGLMKTLASVGGILGSLDLSGAGGATAIAGLIDSLKRPLEGMATGFGSSLFGLVGSLVIGLLARFDSRASDSLKHDFESWIRSAVQIEAASRSASGGGLATGPALDDREVGNWRAVFLVARHTVQANAKVSAQIATLTDGISVLSREIRDQTAATNTWFTQVVRALEQDAAGHGQIARGMERLTEATGEMRQRISGGLVAVSDSLATHSARQESATLTLSDSVHKLATDHGAIVRGLDRLADATGDTRQKLAAQLVDLSETVTAQTARQVTASLTVGDGVEKLATDYQAIARTVERLAGASGEARSAVVDALSHMSDALADRLDRSDATGATLSERLERLRDELRFSHDLASDAARRTEVTEVHVADLIARKSEAMSRHSPEREADELLANLDHLIAATRLDIGEIERLRRMAELMRAYEEAGGDAESVLVSKIAERS